VLITLFLFLSSCCDEGPFKEPVRIYGFGMPTGLALSPDGGSFITGGPLRAVLRDIESGQVRQVFDVGWRWQWSPLFQSSVNAVRALALSPDGTRLVTVDGISEQTIQLWNVETGQPLTTLDRLDGASAVAFSGDGTKVGASSGGTVRLWDAASGQVIATLPVHTNEVTSFAFSPDGSQVVTAHGDDRAARIWDAASGRLVRTLAHAGGAFSAAFTPDGSRVMTATWGDYPGVWLWEAESGELVRRFGGYAAEITSLAFSPNGGLVAAGARVPGEVCLWDQATGELLYPLDQTNPIHSVAFSPDGTHLLTGGSCPSGTTNADVGIVVRVWPTH
jgi:WD40 repeat protein